MRPIWLTAFVWAAFADGAGAATDPAAARKLLEGAAEMASAVHPETAVAAQMRAGMVYGSIDKKTGVSLLSRAFSGVAAVPNAEVREEYATAIVRAVADLDVNAAVALLRQMAKPAPAASAVVHRLLANRQADQAIELLALMPEDVEYPYDAASYLIAYLPADDPRRAISFGRATAAFARTPSGSFPLLVERFAAQMPAALRANAVNVLIRQIGTWKDSNDSFSGRADDDNPGIEIHSPRQNELRELVSVAREFDPASVDGIMKQRPDIASALSGFRQPRKPAEPVAIDRPDRDEESPDSFSPPFGIGMAANFENFRQRIDEYGKATKQAEKVQEVLKKDPAEAVRLAQDLPDAIRAEALAVIASAVMAKDPGQAASVLELCLTELGRTGNPANRIATLVKLGGIYAKRNDPARAHEAYGRALADAIPLWANDTDGKHPNVASRDTWPSTQAVRATAHEATLNLGAASESLLSNVHVPDLALLARVQMARALLGLPMDIHNINVRWTDTPK